jgi:hypothetical protein
LGLCDLLGLSVFTVVAGFLFCRWDVVERAVQSALIPPLHPLQGRQLDLLGGAPRAAGPISSALYRLLTASASALS